MEYNDSIFKRRAGHDNYDGSNATTTVTIVKDSTNLVAEAVTATYNVNKDLVISLTDGQGRQLKGSVVSVDLNGIKDYILYSLNEIFQTYIFYNSYGIVIYMGLTQFYIELL